MLDIIYSTEKISNDLGIFSIDKTADFSRQPYDSKNFSKRKFIVRVADKSLLTDIYQSALKAEPISKQASFKFLFKEQHHQRMKHS